MRQVCQVLKSMKDALLGVSHVRRGFSPSVHNRCVYWIGFGWDSKETLATRSEHSMHVIYAMKVRLRIHVPFSLFLHHFPFGACKIPLSTSQMNIGYTWLNLGYLSAVCAEDKLSSR